MKSMAAYSRLKRKIVNSFKLYLFNSTGPAPGGEKKQKKLRNFWRGWGVGGRDGEGGGGLDSQDIDKNGK